MSDIHRRVFTLFVMEQDRLALDPVQRSEMQDHLSTCPACQANLRLYQGVRAQAGQRWRGAAPQVNMEKVLGRTQIRTRRWWKTMPVQAVLWIGLGLLALGLGEWIFTDLRPTPAVVVPGELTPTIMAPESTPTTQDLSQTWPTPDPEKMILPDDLKDYDNFGAALVADGNLLAVGAPNTDLETGRNIGAVYLFERNGDRWLQVVRLIPDPPQADGRFGSTLALNGEVLVVGAPYEYNPGAGNASGAIYIFIHSNDQWVQAARLSALDGRPFDLFGSALALKAGNIAVGARAADGPNGRDTGAVYLYHTEGQDWTLQARLGNNAASFDHFGHALAFAGDDLLIGAPDADSAQIPNSGRVYVYRETGGSWYEHSTLTAVDSQPQARFGAALSGQGNLLAVVAPQEYQKPGPMPPNAIAYEMNFGTVHVFERKGDLWQWQARLFPDPADEQQGIYANSTVITTLGGQARLAIGGFGRGGPFLFEQRSGSWQAMPGSGLPDLVTGEGMVFAGGQILVGSRFYDAPQPGGGDPIWSGGVVWIIDW
jgi:hypothetical protein